MPQHLPDRRDRSSGLPSLSGYSLLKWERSDLQEVIFALADQQPALRVVPVLNLLRRDMMADKPDGARGRDDKDLHDGPDTPRQGGSSGGTIARQVGDRDEEKNERGGATETTTVSKSDKIQPDTGTRSDHEGADR